MRLSAVLTQGNDFWLAHCEEVDRTGEGRTPDEALASLRDALAEYFDVQAVAPPSDAAPPSSIEIIIVDGPVEGVPGSRQARTVPESGAGSTRTSGEGSTPERVRR
jgi:hypothetical protein